MSATLTENKLLARRYFEHILNAGNFSVADTLLASDFIFRNPPIVAHGVSEFKAVIASVRGAFPDLRFTIHDEIADGDKVVIRWTVTGTQRSDFLGHPASGKTIDVTGDLSAFAPGTAFDIHFRVIETGTTDVALQSGCYRFVIRD